MLPQEDDFDEGTWRMECGWMVYESKLNFIRKFRVELQNAKNKCEAWNM